MVIFITEAETHLQVYIIHVFYYTTSEYDNFVYI